MTASKSATFSSLAKDLFAVAVTAWQQVDHEADELPTLFASPEAIAEVKDLGKSANDLGGFAAMQAVAHQAFCTPSPLSPLGDYTAKDAMCGHACSELNWLWNGIGGWRA